LVLLAGIDDQLAAQFAGGGIHDAGAAVLAGPPG
jgi:hypothetical protein